MTAVTDAAAIYPNPADSAQRTAYVNRMDMYGKAQVALAANITFLAIATPSAAQNAAQAKALTRQVNALIRLQLGALDDVSGT